MMKSRLSLVWIALSILLLDLSAYSADSESEKERYPVLEKDPAVLKILSNLKENESVILPKAKVLGEFNEINKKHFMDKRGPGARDYSLKFAWDSDRKTALYCGANHQAPHRLNDFWEFDLGANAWRQLYAPDNSRTYWDFGDASDVLLNKDGFFQTKRGGPAIIGHVWWQLTYDPIRKKAFYANVWVHQRHYAKKYAKEMNFKEEDVYMGPRIWTFDPAHGKWAYIKYKKPYPLHLQSSMVEFIPELKGCIWHSNGGSKMENHGMWLFHSDKDTCMDLEPKGEDEGKWIYQAPFREQVGYYDRKRKILIAHSVKKTARFNFEAMSWKVLLEEPKDSEKMPFGHDSMTTMYYDPVSSMGLLYHNRTNKLWSFDPDKKEWKSLQPQGVPLSDKMFAGKHEMSYLDPERNIFVIISGTTVWAYRYRTSK